MKGKIRHSAYGMIACGVLLGLSMLTPAAQAHEEKRESKSKIAQVQDTVNEIVQPDSFKLGRETQGGPSYIGIGANFGALGGTSLGDTSLSVVSKIGLTNTFSVRPGVVTDFEDDATFLIPITYDLKAFRVGELGSQEIRVAPYVGAGLAVSTDADAGPLLTGGLDIPITGRWTLNAAANAGFIDDVDLGVTVAAGYHF